MLTPGTVLQDRYRIAGTLGQGGMGAVYEATDLRFGSTVALKETLVNGDDLRKAFEREAKLLNKLRHAALPVVFDYFAEGQGEFLVMQHIPGDDLAELLAGNGGPFAPEVVLRWGDQLLDALEYLHTQEPPVIHRDIKPQNMKLTPRGEVILLDFGLSKTSAAGLTRASTSVSVLGYTPQYAPFEQINGTGTDARSDLYSLAATLYHLATGAPPVDALTRAQSVMNGERDRLTPANELNPSVPVAFAHALQAAMAMNREQRPVNAATLRAMLHGDAACPSPSFAPTVANASLTGAVQSVSGFAPTVTASTPREQTQPAGAGTESPVAAQPRFPLLLKGAVAGAIVLMIAVSGFVLRSGKSDVNGPTSATNSSVETSAAVDSITKSIAPPEATFRFDAVKLDAGGKVRHRESKQGNYFTEDLGGGVSIDMVAIPSGRFLMGSPESEQQDYPDEGPRHEVTLKQFYMGKFEVTQAQWRAVAALPKVTRDLNPDPSKFKGDDLPVESVTWEEAVEFCARLSKKSGRTYRLPSESEWEYAARAGTETAFGVGDAITAEFVNYDGTAPYGAAPRGANRQTTVPVGKLGAANAFGLHDVHGNVWEWNAGEYHASYQGAPTDGSPWLSGGDVKHRVMRGGAWDSFGVDCRSANRLSYAQGGKRPNIGLRVVMSLQ